MTPQLLRRALSFVVVAVIIIATVAPQAWPQTPALDPQTLVGQWTGSWAEASRPGANGRYHLRIERVQGDKVFGKGELVTKTTNEFKFAGTLSGNRLTFGRTELTVDDNRMSGTSAVGPGLTITLTKEK